MATVDGRRLEAVVVTHAPPDHTGAVPQLHAHFPQVPVYATAPTRERTDFGLGLEA